MEEISPQKESIASLYVEDLIDFFMKNYSIAWYRSYGISNSLVGVPILFTPEIGRVAIDISHTYQYRQKVGVSELREYFHRKNTFSCYVYTKAIECLYSPVEASFFHMCAYVGEVAVFCQLENVPYLHQALFHTMTNLMCHYVNLHLAETRSFFQNLAKILDEARIIRVSSELNATLTNQTFQNENLDSNPEAFSAENSSNNHQCAIPSNLNNNVSPLQNFRHPEAVNLLPGASFPHSSSYNSFPLPETTTSGYTNQNLISAQSSPASSSAHQLDWSYHQQVPGYFALRTVPGSMYHSTVEGEFNASHVQQNFVSSSANAPEFISYFNTVNDTNSTEHTTTENVFAMACPRSNSRFQILNVNAPVFVPTVDSSMTEDSETSPKNDENPTPSSNGTHSETN